jgi:hypothetical protein
VQRDVRVAVLSARYELGELAGVAALTAAARAVGDYSIDWLERAVTRRDARVAIIRTQARRLLDDALEAYARALSVTEEPREEGPIKVAARPARKKGTPA